MDHSFDNSTHRQLLLNLGVPLFYALGNEDCKGYIKGQSGRNIVKNIFSEANCSLSMIDFSMLKTIFIKRDQTIFNDFRSAIQEVLHNVYFHCSNEHPEYDKYFIADKNLQLQAIITAALSIIPLTEPEDHSEIIVPQLIDGQWQKIWFKIERIRLTPMPYSTPYYAYGLIPIQDCHGDLPVNVHGQILFMSTNPMPTASGSHHTIMSDTFPGHSAGEHLYLLGITKIQQFINKIYNTTRLPVIAIGQSLGGSIAVISHVYQPDKVLAIAVGPPAWFKNLSITYRKKLTESKKKHNLDVNTTDQDFFKIVHQNINPIIIYTNKQDPIFKAGNYIPQYSKIWQMSSKIGDNSSYFAIHKDCFATHSAMNGLKFEEIDPAIETAKPIRKYITIGWHIISVPLMTLHVLIIVVKAVLHLALIMVKRILRILTCGAVQTPVKHFSELYRQSLDNLTPAYSNSIYSNVDSNSVYCNSAPANSTEQPKNKNQPSNTAP